LCCSLRISGHLPAAIVNGGGDRFWKWKEFKLSRARDLDLGSGHIGIPSCITHRRLPIYQISFKSKKLFVDGRTYGRTYGPTDIFPPILL